MPEEANDKDETQNVMAIENNSPHIVRVPRQARILARPEGILLIVTSLRWFIRIVPLLEGDSREAGMTASGLIYAFPNSSYIFIVLNPMNEPLSLAKL